MTTRITTVLFVLLLVTGAFATPPPGFPHLTVEEPEHGPWSFTMSESPVEVVRGTSGIPLEFSWSADVSWYGGTLVGYRYGWDLADPSNPSDPGWTTPDYELGLTAAPPMSFPLGVHTLHIMAIDDVGMWIRAGFLLDVCNVVPNRIMTWSTLKSAYGVER